MDSRALIIVHPGSIFTSGASQVSPEIISKIKDDLIEEIHSCDTLIVIDGMLSDGVPHDLNLILNTSIDNRRRDGISGRLWGCDAGEDPYPEWKDQFSDQFETFDRVYDCQANAARELAQHINQIKEIRIAGAWGSRDMVSGCVADVLNTLKSELPQSHIHPSEAVLFEEDIDDSPSPM